MHDKGADIDAKDERGKTPLDHSRESGFPHVEKLLLFAKLNVEAGNDIKEIAEKIAKQNGINENWLRSYRILGSRASSSTMRRL